MLQKTVFASEVADGQKFFTPRQAARKGPVVQKHASVHFLRLYARANG